MARLRGISLAWVFRLDIAPAAGHPHGFPFPARLFLHQRQARVGVLPGGTNPDMLRIFGDGQGTSGTREKIQVVNIVARPGDYRMIAAVHQHGIAIFELSGFDPAPCLPE